MKNNILQRTAAIITLGCRVNQYESRALSEALATYGIATVSEDSECGAYIINTCAVTAESERKSRQMIRRCISRSPDAIIAVAGCASQLKQIRIDGVDIIWGSRNKTMLAPIIARLLDNGVKPSLPVTDADSFMLSTPLCDSGITGFDRVRAYVKIEDGCDGKCAYCVIPKLRGPVVSRPSDDIIAEINTLALNGCREVVLTGIETSAYGDGLASLIQRVSAISGIKRIRLGSIDPAFIKSDFIDTVSQVPAFMPHFHLSLQSGCSRTLASMRRKYNADTAMRTIYAIREKMPRVNLSADIICGFPNETAKDFAQTMRFCEEARLLHAHIFTYSSRPNTEAASMSGQIEQSVKSQRSAMLAEMQRKIKSDILDRFVASGEAVPILFEVCENGRARGHTDNFIEIEVKDDTDLRGEIITVKPISHDGDICHCEIC